MQRKIDTRSGVKIQYMVAKWTKYLFPVGGVFLLISGTREFSIGNYWLGVANIFVGSFYGLFPWLKAKTEYVIFKENGISYPSQYIFPKQKFLAYKDISEAKYIVGDFIFRNKDHEIRLAKEFLNEEDVNFLQEKLAELNAID